jgi:excisionase family DNA binding protein
LFVLSASDLIELGVAAHEHSAKIEPLAEPRPAATASGTALALEDVAAALSLAVQPADPKEPEKMLVSLPPEPEQERRGMAKFLFSAKDVTGLLSISRMTLHRLTANGDLAYVRIGSRIGFRREDIEEFLRLRARPARKQRSWAQTAGGAK